MEWSGILLTTCPVLKIYDTKNKNLQARSHDDKIK
jgi:hypothetical protein